MIKTKLRNICLFSRDKTKGDDKKGYYITDGFKKQSSETH